MFEKLQLEKTMYFKDNSQKIYLQSLNELAQKIGQPHVGPKELENIITKALQKAAIQLNYGIPDTKDYRIVIAFHAWVMSIHNDKLISPAGGYPNNIIYDMLAILRQNTAPNLEECLLRFFLEGSNARKISKRKTPNLDFIATTLQLDTIEVFRKVIERPTRAMEKFFNKYKGLTNYISPHRCLVDALTQLKNTSPLYNYLAYNNVFEFARNKNENTGANSYALDTAIQSGINILKNCGQFDLKEMVTKIEQILPQLVANFEKVHEVTNQAYLIALWDASERFCRLYTALSIAAIYNEQYKNVLAKFMDIPLLKEIVERSQTGDFPVIERNNDLKKVELVEFFTQEGISKDAAKLDSNNNNNSCAHYSVIYQHIQYYFSTSDFEIFAILLKHGVDPNAKNQQGTPILFEIAECLGVKGLQLFIDHGADYNETDSRGYTIIELLEHRLHPDPYAYTELAIDIEENLKKSIEYLTELSYNNSSTMNL